jgi:hypothetical protein
MKHPPHFADTNLEEKGTDSLGNHGVGVRDDKDDKSVSGTPVVREDEYAESR